jgi:hypothetical protein
MKPFWITGIGRTATKWLAVCMGWPHEPRDPAPQMVSPAHLHRLAFGSWFTPPGMSVAVIVRDAEDQMRSILSRLAARRLPIEEITLVKRHSIYRQTLDQLVARGAGVMRYEVMTRNLGHLNRELEQAGMPEAKDFLLEPLNVHAARPEFATLPRWAARIAQANQEFYERWLRDRGMRSFTEAASSETTTYSKQKSQPSAPTEPGSSKRP